VLIFNGFYAGIAAEQGTILLWLTEVIHKQMMNFYKLLFWCCDCEIPILFKLFGQ